MKIAEYVGNNIIINGGNSNYREDYDRTGG